MIAIIVVPVLPVRLLIFLAQLLIGAIGFSVVTLRVPLVVPIVFIAVPVVIVLVIRIINASILIAIVAITIPILREGRDRRKQRSGQQQRTGKADRFLHYCLSSMSSAVEESHCKP